MERVTDLPTCKRITVPESANPTEEAKIQVLIDGLEEVMKKCGKAEAKCLKAGSTQLSTLTAQQLKGKESLQKREKAGELIMTGSDKSDKNVPMSVALYKSCMYEHIEGDSELEHKTCDILAAERLRLMRFDNRLIIDSFQEDI